MFQVVWVQVAVNELANAWIQANSDVRQGITAAAHAIDQRLQTNPEEEGESREDNQRTLFEAPLGITFKVHPQQQVVRVLHVWCFR